MADHIPDELLIEILARLPVASLLRFKSVCKPWYSLIASPSFITKHLNQTITNSRRNDSKLLVTCKNDAKKKRYLLLHDDEKFGHEYTELEFPRKLSVGYSRVVGSCNGLVCLSRLNSKCDYFSANYFSVNSHIIIWNPSIRKSVTLPMPFKPQRQCKVVYGFGVHPTTHEYKVVRIGYETDIIRHIYNNPPKAEIYEQGKTSWRGVCSAAPPYYIATSVGFISQAFCSGAVHWVAYDPCEDGGGRNLIVSFNMASESFSEMMLPPTLSDKRLSWFSIYVLGESLVVSCSGESYNDAGCIWLMKEYGVTESWTKISSSILLGGRNKTLGFRKNGEVLLATADNYLASYAPRTNALRNTRIRGVSHASYVDPFIETLVSPEKINVASHGQLTFHKALLPTSEERRTRAIWVRRSDLRPQADIFTNPLDDIGLSGGVALSF